MTINPEQKTFLLEVVRLMNEGKSLDQFHVEEQDTILRNSFYRLTREQNPKLAMQILAEYQFKHFPNHKSNISPQELSEVFNVMLDKI
jgi:hypothetical protein